MIDIHKEYRLSENPADDMFCERPKLLRIQIKIAKVADLEAQNASRFGLADLLLSIFLCDAVT